MDKNTNSLFSAGRNDKIKKSSGVLMGCSECNNIAFNVITNKHPDFILQCVMCKSQFDLKHNINLKATKRRTRITTRKKIYDK